jgi:hypothetical protein
MPRLTYVMEFKRSAGGEPIVASSVAILPGEGEGDGKPLAEYETAVLKATPTLHMPKGSFTEEGNITFGDPAEKNVLTFSSLGLGYMNAYPCPEKPFTGGTVMWRIDSGTGFFKGATGAITANFLIDLNKPGTGKLISYQFGVVYLP